MEHSHSDVGLDFNTSGPREEHGEFIASQLVLPAVASSQTLQHITRSMPNLHDTEEDQYVPREQDDGFLLGKNMEDGNIEFDLTEEQTLETLKYFTSTVSRTNLLSKAHGDDLDVISDLLQEKEKDLEMAAKIGQSLLQRNKNLIMQIESMEEYLNNASERESQIRYEMEMKSELMKKVIRDQDELEQRTFNWSSNESNDSFSIDGSCKDESIAVLQRKCQRLENENSGLFAEAINLRSMTFDEEDKEQQLVMDCIKQLSEAKQQITNLTDEIAMKFEDNVQQQDEITHLITTVVELQKKHKELSYENGELQQQLEISQHDQQCLKSQIMELQRKFSECFEMLQENQFEVKTLKNKVEVCDYPSWHSAGSSSGFYQDSLALELEESMQSETSSQGEKTTHATKVMGAVKMANRNLGFRDGHRSVSGRTSPSNVGLGSEFGSSFNVPNSMPDSASQVHSQHSSDTGSRRQRRGYGGPERLQIVKPLEGSNTLHHWQALASQTARDGLINLAASRESQSADDHCAPDDVRLSDLEDDIFDEEESSGQTTDRSSGKQRPTPTINIMEQSTEDKQQEYADAMASRRAAVKAELKSRSKAAKAGKQPSKTIKPKTIVTRNSNILSSLREGRELLASNEKNGKSKTEVIDMIANAMSKVNLEAKTGQRILESLSSSPPKSRKPSSSSTKKSYPDMPKVTKLLGKMTPEQLLSAAPNESDESRASSLQDTLRKSQDGSDSTTSSILSSSSSRLLSGFFASTGKGLGQQSSTADITNSAEQAPTSTNDNRSSESPARPVLTRSHSSGDLGAMDRSALGAIAFPSGGIMGRVRHNSGGIGLLGMQSGQFGSDESPLVRRRSTSSGNLVDLVRNADIQAAVPNPSSNNANGSNAVAMPTASGGFLRSFFGGGRSAKPASEVNTASAKPGVADSVEKGLSRLGRAFAPDDFGGMGMMSMFSSGRKNSDN